MDAEISRKVAKAFMAGQPFPEDRQRIIQAAEKAGGYASLPAVIKRKIDGLLEGKGGALDSEFIR